LLRDPETPQALQGPASPEGRFAIVTNVGRGMRWTLWRGETNAHEADGEVVWSSHPDADVKLAEVFPLAMVARKPGSPRRARRKPLKPFAQGVPDRFGGPVVDLLVCFFCFAREAAGATVHPAFPAPSSSRDFGWHNSGRNPRRGNTKLCHRERKRSVRGHGLQIVMAGLDPATTSSSQKRREDVDHRDEPGDDSCCVEACWIASLALAMTTEIQGARTHQRATIPAVRP
jgi:hypothetical protein